MKNFIVPFIVLFLMSGAMLLGQYPTDEKISPYPPPVKERTLRQRFVCDAVGAAKWKALHDSLVTPLNESLKIESNGHDPYVLMPPIEKPRAGTFEFRIRMKNKMKPGAEIFWMTTKQPGSKAENSTRFGFVPDGEWYTYSTEFTTPEPLTNIRLDPGTSVGIAEIAWIELYDIVYGEAPSNPTPWVDSNWTTKVADWKTISSGNLSIKFDAKGTGAVVLLNGKEVGEIHPLAYINPNLPLGGTSFVPFYQEPGPAVPVSAGPLAANLSKASESAIEFALPSVNGTLKFDLKNDALRFDLKANAAVFGPVFRPFGEMQQAILNGVEYLEKGEHSSSTADIETKDHLRFAPKSLDITWPFMSVVTDRAAFGLLWDDPNTQAVFATPDFIFGDSTKHHLGLNGEKMSGTVKIVPNAAPLPNTLTVLDSLLLWAFQQRGLPELPKRLRNDEEQRLLNLAAFEKSCGVGPNGTGWTHASLPGATKLHFPITHGSDYVTSIWQLTGKLPSVPKLDNGGAHLQNPASFFLMDRAEDFRIWKRNESKHLRDRQRSDGAFPYSGKYLRGHWEDTASGHCGNSLFRLLYAYRILGEPEALAAALKGLDFANKYTVPRGAQVWELSLHTPDIMGSSRMCMANVWAFEATGDKKYLDNARRWAITGLPFVYFWERKPLAGAADPVMLYATTPVLGATNWQAPNWIGLPVQWCGLDFSEACFMLSKHDQTVDWKKIAEGILITGERMQYPDGPSIGLLPDSFTLATQNPNPYDINPTVLVMQRRLLQGKLEAIDVVLNADKTLRVVSPYKTTFEGNTAVIEGVAGTTYQIIVNGKDVKKIESKGIDRIALP